MTRIALITLAMLGLSTPAVAGSIYGDVPTSTDGPVTSDGSSTPGTESQTSSRSRSDSDSSTASPQASGRQATGASSSRSERGGKNKRTTKKSRKRTAKKKGFKIDSLNPLHGTLVYGPKPDAHHKYANAGNKKKKTVVAKKDLPERSVDRKQTIAAGLRAGTLMHGYSNGASHSDLGLGAMIRYRPTEALGIQADLTHHADQILGAERGQTIAAVSGQVFVFTWNSFSPYALVGFTSNGRGQIPGLGEQANMNGAHIGAGLEVSLGGNTAFDAEARYIGWLNQDVAELSNPSALQVTGGLTIHS